MKPKYLSIVLCIFVITTNFVMYTPVGAFNTIPSEPNDLEALEDVDDIVLSQQPTDTTPPEAVFSLNPETLEIELSGIDDLDDEVDIDEKVVQKSSQA